MNFLAQFPREQLASNLQNGLIIMLLGMGTTFVFLTLLVFLTKGVSALARKIAPKEQLVTANTIVETVSAPAAGNDAEIATAIAAAFVQSKKN